MEVELHTAADCSPVEDEEEGPRTVADSKPAGGKLGCQEEEEAGGSCCTGCNPRAEECTAGMGVASSAALGRAAVQGLRRTGWRGGWLELELHLGVLSWRWSPHWEEEVGLAGQTSGVAGWGRGELEPAGEDPGRGWREKRTGPSTVPPSPSSGQNKNRKLCSEN